MLVDNEALIPLMTWQPYESVDLEHWRVSLVRSSTLDEEGEVVDRV